jgi:hypothetical protein
VKKGDLVCFRGKRPGLGVVEVLTGRVTGSWRRNDEDYVHVSNEYGSWTKVAYVCWPADAVTQLGAVIREDSD